MKRWPMTRWLVFGGVAAVVFGVTYAFVSRSTPAPVRGLETAAVDPFDESGGVSAAFRAIYSPDGAKLAVLSSRGLGLADGGEIQPITTPGSKVVDAAWFPAGTALLVAEGPIPTGTLAVVETDGNVRGTVTLDPVVAFGGGYGMDVAPDNRSAVVTGVERATLGAEQRYLAHVDLLSGATRVLTPLGGPDESAPVFVDDTHVAFTEGPSGGPNAVRTVDVGSGEIADVASGATLGGVIFVGSKAQVALQRTSPEGVTLLEVGRHRLGDLPPGTSLVALHPAGLQAVVNETVEDPSGATTTRLRRLALRPPTEP